MAGKTDTKGALESRKSDALDELYREFLSRTENSRRLASLKNLYETLRHLLSVGSNATSVAAITRAAVSLGFESPKAQSIRNSEGKDFRDLINAYVTLVAKAPSGEATDEDQLVGGIDDLKVAAQVRWLLNENRSLKRRLDLLHSAFQKLEPIKLIGTTLMNEDGNDDELLGLTKIEIEAIREFKANLFDIQCMIDETSGALLYKGNLEIAPPGFGQALSKLTEKNAK